MSDLGIATIFSSLISRFLGVFFQLDIRITNIFLSTTSEEDYPMFLLRAIIANRGSLPRTVYKIKVSPLWKWRKGYSIEPLFHEYRLSGQNVISSIANPMTIDAQTKALGDNIFRLPLDISVGQSTIQWIALKVSRKSQAQHSDNMKCRLVLLNVNEKLLGETILTLTI